MRFKYLLALMPLLVGACAGDSTTGPAPAVPIENTTFASSLGVNLSASTKTASGLYYRDITVGTGADLTAGKTVGANYQLYFTNGTLFQASSTPFSFKLGAGQVIKGWDEGLVGMKVGGVRQLVVPPTLAYGSADYNGIPGNSVLVFNVTAVSAQ